MRPTMWMSMVWKRGKSKKLPLRFSGSICLILNFVQGRGEHIVYTKFFYPLIYGAWERGNCCTLWTCKATHFQGEITDFRPQSGAYPCIRGPLVRHVEPKKICRGSRGCCKPHKSMVLRWSEIYSFHFRAPKLEIKTEGPHQKELVWSALLQDQKAT